MSAPRCYDPRVDLLWVLLGTFGAAYPQLAWRALGALNNLAVVNEEMALFISRPVPPPDPKELRRIARAKARAAAAAEAEALVAAAGRSRRPSRRRSSMRGGRAAAAAAAAEPIADYSDEDEDDEDEEDEEDGEEDPFAPTDGHEHIPRDTAGVARALRAALAAHAAHRHCALALVWLVRRLGGHDAGFRDAVAECEELLPLVVRCMEHFPKDRALLLGVLECVRVFAAQAGNAKHWPGNDERGMMQIAGARGIQLVDDIFTRFAGFPLLIGAARDASDALQPVINACRLITYLFNKPVDLTPMVAARAIQRVWRRYKGGPAEEQFDEGF